MKVLDHADLNCMRKSVGYIRHIKLSRHAGLNRSCRECHTQMHKIVEMC